MMDLFDSRMVLNRITHTIHCSRLRGERHHAAIACRGGPQHGTNATPYSPGPPKGIRPHIGPTIAQSEVTRIARLPAVGCTLTVSGAGSILVV